VSDNQEIKDLMVMRKTIGIKDATATHCNTLQHTATHCNTLQHAATHCNTLQHTAPDPVSNNQVIKDAMVMRKRIGIKAKHW